MQHTRDMLEWLAWEADNAKDDIANDVAYEGGLKAKVIAGRLVAMERIAASIVRPAALPEVTDEPFRDPAERRRKNSEPQTPRTTDDSGTE